MDRLTKVQIELKNRIAVYKNDEKVWLTEWGTYVMVSQVTDLKIEKVYCSTRNTKLENGV